MRRYRLAKAWESYKSLGTFSAENGTSRAPFDPTIGTD
jgi:hypothetical protein